LNFLHLYSNGCEGVNGLKVVESIFFIQKWRTNNEGILVMQNTKPWNIVGVEVLCLWRKVKTFFEINKMLVYQSLGWRRKLLWMDF
jgi:hypothetical protein